MLGQRGARTAAIASCGMAVLVVSSCSSSARHATPPTSTTASPATASTTSPRASTSTRSLPAPSTTIVGVRRCQPSQLHLALGSRLSEPSGQHTLLLTLTNVSQSGCSLFGYPGLTFIDAEGRDLPLRIFERGDEVVSSRSPTPVNIAPRAVAYATINKYRCDLGDKLIARQVRITLPGGKGSLSVAFGSSTMGMNYCGPGDPGSKVYVSPVTATLRESLAH